MAQTIMDLVQAAKAEITEISASQADDMLASGSIAIDVRELAEYDSGHVSNARHLSRGMLEFMIGGHPDFQDKATSIIVYCKSGGRSALATVSLQKLGFTNVHSVMGGFDMWSAG